jgi:hypothetical protein
MKKTYFVVYNYGMGGVWSIMTARSEGEITTKYPELNVYRDRPTWMDDDFHKHLLSTRFYDIDEKPHGWLESLVAGRK